jgi:hypothetical protein
MRAAFAVLVALTLGATGCVIASRPTDPALAFGALAFLGLLAIGMAPPEGE